jgi:hypothetical protein
LRVDAPTTPSRFHRENAERAKAFSSQTIDVNPSHFGREAARSRWAQRGAIDVSTTASQLDDDQASWLTGSRTAAGFLSWFLWMIGLAALGLGVAFMNPGSGKPWDYRAVIAGWECLKLAVALRCVDLLIGILRQLMVNARGLNRQDVNPT